ncbi:hypothetical protein IscW_ISCW022437 [Ixodes scapularis]|uniref:Uncharacterized protein n=1 Tax=Ixodes scapularis TaxID=6945 RepID=B7QAL2_IXOSC|nr:hypothetical protein IscW_ISCW022437 [Ixodes scapularis]|eukprot:XP_002412588.1 hypothetical protein IscW_ISCW022437 [Ixodes scapularis]
MAQNAECLDTILAGLKRHMEGIIKLTSLVDGDRLQRPLAVLFNKLLLSETPFPIRELQFSVDFDGRSSFAP